MSRRGYPDGVKTAPRPKPDNRPSGPRFPGKTGFPLPFRKPPPAPGFGRAVPKGSPRAPLRYPRLPGVGLAIGSALILGDLLDGNLRFNRPADYWRPKSFGLFHICSNRGPTGVIRGFSNSMGPPVPNTSYINWDGNIAKPFIQCIGGQAIRTATLPALEYEPVTSITSRYGIWEWNGDTVNARYASRAGYVRYPGLPFDDTMVQTEPTFVGPSPFGVPYWPLTHPVPYPGGATPLPDPKDLPVPDAWPDPAGMPTPRNPVPVVPHVSAPPGPRVKERKMKADRLAWWLLNVYGQLTEVFDALDALYKSLPKDKKTPSYYKGVRIRASRTTRQADCYRLVGEANAQTFITEFAKMQLEDFLIGKSDPNRALNKGSGAANGISRFESTLVPKTDQYDIKFDQALAKAAAESAYKRSVNGLAIKNQQPWVDWKRFRVDPAYRVRIEALYGKAPR